MNSFGGLLGAAIVGVIVVVAAGGCSRSELDFSVPNFEGGTPDGGGDEVPDGFVEPEGAPPNSCGNGTCDANENCMNCALDCGACKTCGNGTCDTTAGETCSNCPMDCGECVSCGDGFCTMPQENCQNCAVDCGMCPGCGDGKCTPPNETCFSCPQDCGKCMGCGDGLCSMPSETCSSCPMDCGPCDVCGNNKCEAPFETCVNCPADCGKCPLKSCLQELTCAIGCIGGLGGGGGIPMINIQCLGDCVAEGCPGAQLFVQNALDCFLQALATGQCMGISIGCLMTACPGQIAACLGNHC